jgi:hypothetical protein
MVLVQRQIDHWNIIEDPQSYGHLTFDKGAKTIHWGEKKKDNIFDKWCWFNRWSACRRMKIVLILSPVQSSSPSGSRKYYPE